MGERVFTLRLTQEESEALEELKKIGKEKTDSKIIRYMILRFKAITEELRLSQIENFRMTKELTELKGEVMAYNEALKDLKKIK